MSVAARSRKPVLAPWLELHAHRISDPIERLLYLRREMHRLEHSAAPRAWRSRQLLWILGTLALAGAAGVKPAGNAVTPRRDQRLALPSTPVAAPMVEAAASGGSTKVWRVERTDANEMYSNGLRIDLTYSVHNHPREQYPVYSLNGGLEPARYAAAPAGIVFHTTESHLAPFEEEENRRLEQLGRNLLELIRREHSYHYVIDRFGRVFRVVEESDAANHAGYSVWADPGGIYVNLNSSFLGIAFEGQTDAADSMTPAQISSARMLTEMLRSRYSIAPENCVTHAQVSVNPLNMHIGAHTDWGTRFPFAQAGLPDNYATSLPSLYAFGFEYDSAFEQAIGGRWAGLNTAETQVTHQAASENLPLARYRAILQRRYKDIIAALKQAGSEGEN